MTKGSSPKDELIATLEAMARLTEGGAGPAGGGIPMALRMVQIRALLPHARMLADRVGAEARRKKGSGV